MQTVLLGKNLREMLKVYFVGKKKKIYQNVIRFSQDSGKYEILKKLNTKNNTCVYLFFITILIPNIHINLLEQIVLTQIKLHFKKQFD